MAVIPNSIDERLAFFTDHINLWNDNAATIGLTSEQVAAFLTTRLNPAADAVETARVAREASKNATAAAETAMNQLLAEGRALVSTIQATAKAAGATGGAAAAEAVYQAGGIPAPDAPTRAQAPEQPSALDVRISNVGRVTVSWKGQMPGRGVWEVRRVVEDADGSKTGPTAIGVAVEREFIDAAVPAGTLSCTYQVRGVNTTGAGEWSAGVTATMAEVPTTPAFTLRSTVGRAAA